jgi:molybdate transport system ATP-binding protein
LQIVLILTKEAEVPDFIKDIRRVESNDESIMLEAHPEMVSELLAEQQQQTKEKSDDIVNLRKVKIQYGPRTILKDLDWNIRRGERWALSGQNGAGKSTLLSIICCDNPQSYANDVALFGMQRGHGESIWEIKKHIGYVSPEMHRSYTRDLPVMRIIASGLKDTIGLYVQPTEEDYAICRKWMRVFGIEDLAERSFIKLSSGEQRLVLVVRAFVKCPDLLILDEPLHGLDQPRSEMVKNIIDEYCKDRNKTLIMVTHYEENLPKCITDKIVLKRNI